MNLISKSTIELHRIEGGYHQEQDAEADGYWWIPSGRQGFNAGKFYLPEKTQDPFGNKSFIEYDEYGLLMTKAIDPLDNAIEAKNNYRVLQPFKICAPDHARDDLLWGRCSLGVKYPKSASEPKRIRRVDHRYA